MFDATIREEAAGEVDAGAPALRFPDRFPPSGRRAAPPDRYGARKGVNIPTVLMVVAVHAAVIAALVQMRSHVVHRKEAALTVVNLSPPPPPPAAETPPPPPAPQVVVPPPLVRTPLPQARTITVTPVPVPVAAPLPPAPPAPPMVAPSIVRASDLGTRMVAGKPPRYPIESRRRHEQGTVVLSVTLGLDGAVDAVTVARSSGHDRLDDAARDAVRSWRWEPTVQNGQPVRVTGLVEIPFVLRA